MFALVASLPILVVIVLMVVFDNPRNWLCLSRGL